MAGDRDSSSSALIASRLVVGLAGPWPTDEEALWLAHRTPTGVILFSRNIIGRSQLSDLCAYLHALLPDGEIMADHEGGPVSQLVAAVGRPPACWSLGALDDTELTQAVHAATGRRLLDAGIDRVLAPCADVLVNVANPVIGARSFGSDVDLVSRHVAAAVTGLLSSGVGVCLKHWPGHGATGGDSHETAVAGADGYLVEPFAAGLQAGADAVMIGHLAVDGSQPATLDPAVAQAVRDLGRTWAPGGDLTLLADDITMGALRAPLDRVGVPAPDGATMGLVEPADLPVPWLVAVADGGCDQLLCRGIPWRACPLPETGERPASRAPGAWATVGPDSARESAHTSDHGRAGVRGPDDDGPDPEAYAEVRRRLLSGTSFLVGGEVLFWLDLTAGDRWGGGAQAVDLRRALDERFSSVVTVRSPHDSTGIPVGCHHVLVTGYRPLTEAWGAVPVWATLSETKGYCLVMGHPSLAESVAERLGTGWSINAVYDIDARDLSVDGV